MKICFISTLLLSTVSLFAQNSRAVKPFNPHLMQQFLNVRDFTISPDGEEAYFTAQSPLGELSVMMRLNKVDGDWTGPEIVSFSGRYMDLEPFLTSDGLRLFFASNRPLDQQSDETRDFDIWYVQRYKPDDAWSQPINLGSPVNTEYNEFYPSLASNNNLYFTSDRPYSKGKDDIYFSAWQKDHYSPTISMSDSINSEGYEFNAFIAPDESFIIYSGYNRDDGFGSGDLYISYRKEDDTWSTSENLGLAFNTAQMDYCPFVQITTHTLFFTSKRSNLKNKQSGFTSTQEFLKVINGFENGLSRIYQAPFDQFIK